MSIKKFTFGLAVVALALGVAVSAGAQTTDLQTLLADIARLEAQIRMLTGGAPTGGVPMSGATSFTRDLTIGSSGADVTALQTILENGGYLVMPVGVPKGYFGNLTKMALAAWQTANNVSPAAGYFGPKTRAAIGGGINVLPPVVPGTGPAVCPAGYTCTPAGGTPVPPTPAPTGLEGGAGSINDVDYVTGINNEKVGEADEDQEVVGLTIEADSGSDLEITAVNINFSKGTGATHDFLKYATDVSVWLGDEEFARVDADEFTKNNNYDKNVTMDSGAIIRAGKKGNLVVKVSGVGNMDSADEGDTWTAEIESVRYEDADSAVITDSATGDINDGAGRSFTFESFATATNAELKIAEKSADINDAHVIDVHATDDTLDVPVLSFTMENKGDSDLLINSMGASTTVTGATDVDDLIKEITIWIEGDEIASGVVHGDQTSPATQKDWEFEELDYTISAGSKVDAEIRVTFNSVADSLDEGDTLAIDILEAQTDTTTLWDVEDDAGNQLADGDLTGTATAGAHSVYDAAIQVVYVGPSSGSYDDADSDDASDELSGADDEGTFKIKFTVTAFGSDVYLDGDVAMSTSTATTGASYLGADGVMWASTTDTTDNAKIWASTSQEILEPEESDTSNDVTTTNAKSFYIQDGDTRTFTLTVLHKPQINGSVNEGIRIIGFNWDTDSGDIHDMTYSFDMGAYKTETINLIGKN